MVHFEDRSDKQIHFIWWGNPAESTDIKNRNKLMDSAFFGVNQLVGINKHRGSKGEDWEINYWFDQAFEDLFDRRLKPEITRRPINQFDLWGACKPANEDAILSADLLHSIPRVLESLRHYGAFSAMKDLSELIVLHAEGGFFFDSTFFVPDKAKFVQALEQEELFPRFVLNDSRNSANYYFDPHNHESFPGVLPTFNKRVPFVDVWSMAAKPGDIILASTISQYIERWLFITQTNQAQQLRFPEANKDRYCNRQGKLSNLSVGRLIEWSLKDGLIQTYGNNYEQMLAHCLPHWLADDYVRVFQLLDNEEEYLKNMILSYLLPKHKQIELGELEGAIIDSGKACEILIQTCFNSHKVESLFKSDLPIHEKRFFYEILKRFKGDFKGLENIKLPLIEKFDREELVEFDLRTLIDRERYFFLKMLKTIFSDISTLFQLIDILRDAREERLQLIYEGKRERQQWLLDLLEIHSLQDFIQFHRGIPIERIPPQRRMSTWHPAHQFFKKSGQTWK